VTVDNGVKLEKWVRDAIFAGIQKPAYSRIHVPGLAILAVPLPLDEQFKKYPPRTASCHDPTAGQEASRIAEVIVDAIGPFPTPSKELVPGCSQGNSPTNWAVRWREEPLSR
jgi:hypothetical protein